MVQLPRLNIGPNDTWRKSIEVRVYMRIAEINMVHVGSTGRIMMGIADVARAKGNSVRTFSAKYYQRYEGVTFDKQQNHTYFGWPFENMLHLRLAQITGLVGCFSCVGTFQLLKDLDLFAPDIVHLHNLHNCSINIPLLFGYLRRKKIKVVWTLHDCWAFTGKCPHFVVAKCDKWKTQCHHCVQLHQYPKSLCDNTKLMYRQKKKWFTTINDIKLVTPSKWLEEFVRKSFLKDYPVQVINNGIDLRIFHPVASDIRGKYGIDENRKIILGVAFGWGYKKGLDVFLRIASILQDGYQVVLVGTSDAIDNELPNDIVSIHRTNNQYELAEIYSAADVFVNPTREDNFPTVNIEALACGTPVVTFNTGGSPEILDETCGIVVPCDDIPALEKAIRHVVEDKPFTAEACRRRAEKFDMQDKFAEYVQLYHDLYEKK